MLWLRHGKNPGWFRSLPVGEQAFLLAADAWDIENSRKKPGTTTLSLEQVARIGKQ